MRSIVMAAVSLAALPAHFALAALPAHAVGSGMAPMGEVWVWPSMFEQALAPLAPLSGKVARDGLCPGLSIGEDRVVHKYDIEAKFRARGIENRRYEITDIRVVNPSGCEALDREVLAQMRQSIPQFAQPRVDSDKNGWTKIPRIEIRLTD